MTNNTHRYISVAETAQMLRKALKASFPNTKFSVRSSSYSGGASIRVSYTNGPKASDVEKITRLYTGASFDGMQDLKEYHDSLIMSQNGPELVSFGADFIFVNREYDEATYNAMLARVLSGMVVEDGDARTETVRLTDPNQYGFFTYRDEELSKLDLVGRDGNAHEWTCRVLSQMSL